LSRLYISYRPVTPTPPIPPVTYEPETEIYLDAIGIANDSTIYFGSTAYEILGSTIWAVLDACVVQIKTAIGLTLGTNNLSTKFKFIYPNIGGTSTAHAYNLVTGTSEGTFSGGVTHTPAGWYGNGTNGYFTTTYKYDTATFSQNNQSFAFLSKTNTDVFYTDFGAAGFGFGNLTLRARYSGVINTECAIAGGITNSVSDSLGLIGVNRTSSANYKVMKDGSVLATNTATSVALPTTGGFIVFGANNNNGSIIQYSPRQMTWLYGGLGFTDTENADIYSAIATFEIALNR
jgi:hypothetical protein